MLTYIAGTAVKRLLISPTEALLYITQLFFYVSVFFKTIELQCFKKKISLQGNSIFSEGLVGDDHFIWLRLLGQINL